MVSSLAAGPSIAPQVLQVLMQSRVRVPTASQLAMLIRMEKMKLSTVPPRLMTTVLHFTVLVSVMGMPYI